MSSGKKSSCSFATFWFHYPTVSLYLRAVMREESFLYNEFGSYLRGIFGCKAQIWAFLYYKKYTGTCRWFQLPKPIIFYTLLQTNDRPHSKWISQGESDEIKSLFGHPHHFVIFRAQPSTTRPIRSEESLQKLANNVIFRASPQQYAWANQRSTPEGAKVKSKDLSIRTKRYFRCEFRRVVEGLPEMTD